MVTMGLIVRYNVFLGFSSFHCDDQITIIRLGQSPSRILMAALNWYDADQKNFRNFLSWRDKQPGRLDLFKQKLIEYAEDISSLEVDAIEAALLNVLLILATGKTRFRVSTSL